MSSDLSYSKQSNTETILTGIQTAVVLSHRLINSVADSLPSQFHFAVERWGAVKIVTALLPFNLSRLSSLTHVHTHSCRRVVLLMYLAVTLCTASNGEDTRPLPRTLQSNLHKHEFQGRTKEGGEGILANNQQLVLKDQEFTATCKNTEGLSFTKILQILLHHLHISQYVMDTSNSSFIHLKSFIPRGSQSEREGLMSNVVLCVLGSPTYNLYVTY